MEKGEYEREEKEKRRSEKLLLDTKLRIIVDAIFGVSWLASRTLDFLA